MRSGIALVGPFPPPMHGVSAVNSRMQAVVATLGLPVTAINTALASLDRRFRARLGRSPRIARSLVRLAGWLRQHPGGVCYFSVSGGPGLLYEALFLLLVRSMDGSAQVILHHHSYHYVDRNYLPLRLVQWLAGRQALHLVLSAGMEQVLKNRYGSIRRCRRISNAAFVDVVADVEPRPGRADIRVLGMLANLSAAKGVDDFLALAALSAANGQAWEFHLAGPFEDAATEQRCRRVIGGLSNVRYFGPVHGGEKWKFLAALDVFVFPTRYFNEAEPLVLLEAMSLGVPAIAYGRGCIPDLLAGGGGSALAVGTADFPGQALAILRQWAGEREEFRERRLSAQRRFAQLRAESIGSLQEMWEQAAGVKP